MEYTQSICLAGLSFSFISQRTNLGLVGNWNRCLELALGEWIKFVFQDDWLTPDCIECMVSASISSQSLLTVCRREFVF